MQLFSTTITDEAIERVVAVLRSTFINEGDVVGEFEARLRDFTGAPHVVTLNSGTSALHLALMILGVGPGDEVIVPPQTFIATALAVMHCGAKPVFADIDAGTGNIDPVSIAACITERTKAVMPVHWGGLPCDLDAIAAVCDPRGLPVIEDAAHAFGARYKGRAIGTISRMTCFSFQAIKGMTTGDGGAIAARGERDAFEAFTRRWFGINKRNVVRSVIGERSASVEVVGYKYHMNNIAAAIGLGNLATYGKRLARRRAIDKAYRARLAAVPGARLLDLPAGCESACWLFGMLVERREDFGRAMKERGIPVSVIDRRVDRNPVFGGLTPGLAGAEKFDAHHIALPIHDQLSDAEVDEVVAAVRGGW